MTSRRPYLCSKTMERRPYWFVPINLHRCRPREWIRFFGGFTCFIVHVLRDKLEARDRAVPLDPTHLSNGIQAVYKSLTRATMFALCLFARHQGPTCTYSKQRHPSNSCKIATKILLPEGYFYTVCKILFAPEKNIWQKLYFKNWMKSSVQWKARRKQPPNKLEQQVLVWAQHCLGE